MTDNKPEVVKAEPFKSTATIYKEGSGRGFEPGSEVPLHPDHAEQFRKAGLEQGAPKKEKGK